MNEESVELCIETTTNANDSPVHLKSLESSMSTYDSMIQTLHDELNNGNKENNDHGSVIDFMDFEDMDFFNMDCATAMSFDYEMNYTMKQLKHIAGYYGIKNKTRKVDMIQDILV